MVYETSFAVENPSTPSILAIRANNDPLAFNPISISGFLYPAAVCTVQPMESTSHSATSTLETAIEHRVADIESAKYARATATALTRFAAWAETQGVEHPQEVTAQLLRRYARHLGELVADEGSPITTNSTAEQYFNNVSAFLSWCVREELIETNPAQTRRAREPLPESDGQRRQQFWSERDRAAICTTADRVVETALDENSTEQQRLKTFRDRALVYTLAYTGCRTAELFAVKDDSKRTGVRWEHIDFDTGSIRVYGKQREQEDAPLFEPCVEPLQRWKRVLNPDADWPVFPTLHLPSLYELVSEERQRTPANVWDGIRESGSTPPALSTTGARGALKRLCEISDYEFDEPLKPHGARRGLGDLLYQEQAELAQEALRHKTIETTHQSYSEQRISRVKERGDAVIDP